MSRICDQRGGLAANGDREDAKIFALVVKGGLVLDFWGARLSFRILLVPNVRVVFRANGERF